MLSSATFTRKTAAGTRRFRAPPSMRDFMVDRYPRRKVTSFYADSGRASSAWLRRKPDMAHRPAVLQFCKPNTVKSFVGYECTIRPKNIRGRCAAGTAVPHQMPVLCATLFPGHRAPSLTQASCQGSVGFRTGHLQISASFCMGQNQVVAWDVTPFGAILTLITQTYLPIHLVLAEALDACWGRGTGRGTDTHNREFSPLSRTVVSLVFAGIQLYDLVTTIIQYKKRTNFARLLRSASARLTAGCPLRQFLTVTKSCPHGPRRRRIDAR